MSVSVHAALSGDVIADIVSPRFFCQTLPTFSREIGSWVRCRIRWFDEVCCGFLSVALNDFFMAIVLSWIARIFNEGSFASAKMALTGVVRSWPVMARPAWRCDHSRFSNVEFIIHGRLEDSPYSTFERHVAM